MPWKASDRLKSTRKGVLSIMQRQTYTLKNPKTGQTKTLKNVPGWFAHQTRQEVYPKWVFVKA
ncbi:MAG: hypothetical protein AAFX78_18445 [Cyanobacteria bacterium J06638_20]